MYDAIVVLISKLGGLGVFLLMFGENLFPPIPSEVILPLAGYTAAQGRGSLPVVIMAGTLGSVAGATLWYYVGRWIGIERLKRFAADHGRWLTLTPEEIDRVDKWFDRYGRWAVLFGRLLPGIRTLISVPAGVTGMALGPFWPGPPSDRRRGLPCWPSQAMSWASATARSPRLSSRSAMPCWRWQESGIFGALRPSVGSIAKSDRRNQALGVSRPVSHR